MIKGIRKGSTGMSLRYDDQLVVPIIENKPYERDLVDSLRTAIEGKQQFTDFHQKVN